MSRFQVLLVATLLMVALAGLGLRWWWRELRRPRPTGGRRTARAVVLLACLLLLALTGAGLPLLWHERPDQPATPDDLRILEAADALLSDESAWNRQDDKACDDDRAKGAWSLFCALEAASIQVGGRYDHTRVALQEVRFAIEERYPGTPFKGRLMDFNNLPETRFADVKGVLRTATRRVARRLEDSPR